jgi:hypothetical protein
MRKGECFPLRCVCFGGCVQVEVDILNQLDDYEKVKKENQLKQEHWHNELNKLRAAHAGKRPLPLVAQPHVRWCRMTPLALPCPLLDTPC